MVRVCGGKTEGIWVFNLGCLVTESSRMLTYTTCYTGNEELGNKIAEECKRSYRYTECDGEGLEVRGVPLQSYMHFEDLYDSTVHYNGIVSGFYMCFNEVCSLLRSWLVNHLGIHMLKSQRSDKDLCYEVYINPTNSCALEDNRLSNKVEDCLKEFCDMYRCLLSSVETPSSNVLEIYLRPDVDFSFYRLNTVRNSDLFSLTKELGSSSSGYRIQILRCPLQYKSRTVGFRLIFYLKHPFGSKRLGSVDTDVAHLATSVVATDSDPIYVTIKEGYYVSQRDVKEGNIPYVTTNEELKYYIENTVLPKFKKRKAFGLRSVDTGSALVGYLRKQGISVGSGEDLKIFPERVEVRFIGGIREWRDPWGNILTEPNQDVKGKISLIIQEFNKQIPEGVVSDMGVSEKAGWVFFAITLD